MIEVIKISRRSFLKYIGAIAALSLLGERTIGKEKILFSLAPLQDSFPIAFGYEKGVFAENGVEMKLVGISSARERNTAIFAGRIDGVLGDVASVVFGLANAGAEIAITSTAFESKESRSLALLSSGFLRIESLDKLLARTDSSSQNSIALARRTDMEFATDLLIEQNGFLVDERNFYTDSDDPIKTATLLLAGSILGAVLPEPVATLVEKSEIIEEQYRARLISSYEEVDLMPSVIVFHQKIREKAPKLLSRFYQAYSESIELVNNTPPEEIYAVGLEGALSLFLPGLKGEFKAPEDFEEAFHIPYFPQPRMLSKSELEAVVGWALKKGYIYDRVSYERTVDEGFL